MFKFFHIRNQEKLFNWQLVKMLANIYMSSLLLSFSLVMLLELKWPSCALLSIAFYLAQTIYDQKCRFYYYSFRILINFFETLFLCVTETYIYYSLYSKNFSEDEVRITSWTVRMNEDFLHWMHPMCIFLLKLSL